MQRGFLATVSTAVTNAITKAQATADNARQMVLKRDRMLADLDKDTATLGDAIAAASTEHAAMRSEWETGDVELGKRIDDIELTPGPVGPQGPAGRDGADSTVAGPAGPAGKNGVDGLPGKDGAPGGRGPAGSVGPTGTAGRDGATGPAGAIGPAGPAGATGAAGRDGATGPAGPAGATGPTGQTGPQGPEGDTGAAGAPGSSVTLDYRDGIAVPAVLSLLGIAATVDVTVTWNTPFPDTAYTIVKPQVSSSPALIGKTDATVKSKTTTGCVITVTTTAVLAAGTCTLSGLAYRKG